MCYPTAVGIDGTEAMKVAGKYQFQTLYRHLADGYDLM